MAKPNTKKSGSNLKPFYLLLGAIAVVGAVLIVLGVRGGGGTPVTAPVDLESMDARTLLERARGEKVGADTAPLKMMVFSDYTCPGCGAFANQIFPYLKQEFIDTGKVQFTYYDFPLGPGGGHEHGFIAARAARCAGDQGKFWEYHDLIFTRQGDWSFSRNTPTEQLADYGPQVGIDREALLDCINSDQHAELVSANRALGDQLRVNSTPTVIVGSRVSASPLDWAGLRAEINAALGN